MNKIINTKKIDKLTPSIQGNEKIELYVRCAIRKLTKHKAWTRSIDLERFENAVFVYNVCIYSTWLTDFAEYKIVIDFANHTAYAEEV